jgi:hypothetical protein
MLETNTKHTDDLKQEVHTPDFEVQQSKAAVNENGSQESEPEANIKSDVQGLPITIKTAGKLVCAIKELECLVDDQIKLADYSLNLAADVSIMSEKLQELVAWLGNNIVFVRTPTQKDNGGNIVNAAVVAS